MKEISLNDKIHDWEKQNTTTIQRGGKYYDIYKCKLCGIQGKSYSLGTIAVAEKYTDRILKCKKKKKNKTNTIKITHCSAFGKAFENLIDGSVHEVIQPPKGETNKNGVWVMGVNEPVKILLNEFEYYEENHRNNI